ncbi:LacI family DNA-binding transcriptional regulator [Lichenicola cladoniae]|uniref:LacI family DNA-binding transcriptional regulator n=1 Tax=Lichenicola cladoniae TaxID=1484109 RepID=A0A6M8HJN9_9PROT|nr:LacI family DNA-binding transcriptional regulator [Lichenicola cladoniae]NPD69181.1 LacI family DNA-binding transcriptional regulator [Acetobacteraceae bacterium]QKE89008.1 LacI family DNA-binding transcriptional regulator [Lichenicola cladoniae]
MNPPIPLRRRVRTSAVTLKDVAERAGVAPITVSRAINSPDSVSPSLRALIDVAVAELGYVPNRFAGALASAESRIIPVIVPSLSNAVFIEVIEGIQAILEAEGYQLLLGNTQYDLERETALVSTLLGWSPAGIIVAGLRHAERTRALLRGCGRPVVEIMELGTRPIDMNVGLSHSRAGTMMGEHLIARGYRRIGFVGGWLDGDYRAMQRFRGLDRALAAAGLERRPPFTFAGGSSPEIGGDQLLAVMAQAPELDALFFANDDLAVGALLRAAHAGIAVPGRIAIAGFNGLGISALTRPSLTTIVSPRCLIGETAARKLLARVAGTSSGPDRVDVGCHLAIREST